MDHSSSPHTQEQEHVSTECHRVTVNFDPFHWTRCSFATGEYSIKNVWRLSNMVFLIVVTNNHKWIVYTVHVTGWGFHWLTSNQTHLNLRWQHQLSSKCRLPLNCPCTTNVWGRTTRCISLLDLSTAPRPWSQIETNERMRSKQEVHSLRSVSKTLGSASLQLDARLHVPAPGCPV